MADVMDNELAPEFEEMEDQRDAVTLMLARMEQANAERRPWSVVQRLHAGEHPVLVFRELRDMSRGELAAAAGVSAEAIEAFEAGQVEGGLRILRAIAQALRVDLDDLVPWAGPEDP